MSEIPLRIGIIDYGAGNLRSVQNALKKLGADSQVLLLPEEISRMDGIVLPGVGSFGYAAISLERSGFARALRAAAEKTPLLGICLGMQLFFDSSDESPGVSGLGLVRGHVRTLQPSSSQKVPNMGWCSVATTRAGLMGDAGAVANYYFAHSYVCEPGDKSIVSALVTGQSDGFVAVIEQDMLAGVQFHPEKSGPDGLTVLKRFLSLCRRCKPC